MILRANLINVLNNGTSIPDKYPLINSSIGANYMNCSIYMGGELVTSFLLDSSVIGTGVGYPGFKDDNGVTVPLYIEPQINSYAVTLFIQIDFYNTWDSATLTIVLEDEPTNHIHFNRYSNTFKIYGYDLGRDYNYSTSYVPSFDIWLSLDNDTQVYSNFIAYRRIFSNRIDIYHAVSDFRNIPQYIWDSNTVSAFNTYICHDEEIVITQMINTIHSDITVPVIFYLPRWTVSNNCSACYNDCVNVFLTPTVELNIDYLTPWNALNLLGIGMIFRNDVRVYPYHNQSMRIEISDNMGNIVAESSTIQYLPSGYSTITLPQPFTLEYSLPERGSYIIKGCIDISGYLTYIQSGDIPETNAYYMLYGSSIAGTFDFSNLCTHPIVSNALPILADSGDVTPNNWGGMTLVKVIVDGDLEVGKHYRILNIANGADFDNLTGHTSVVNDVFIVQPNTIAPTSWGNSQIGNYGNCKGGIVAEVQPIIECCKSDIVDGCYPFAVVNNSCNESTIYNYSARYIANYTISKIEDGGLVEIGTGHLDTYPNTGSTEVIELLEQGVYIITVVYIAGETETSFSQVIIVDCEINDCTKRYIDKLLCCNPETNCDGCESDDCKKKDYYDYNAFMLLLMEYYSVINSIYDLGYVYYSQNLTEVIGTLYKLNDLLTAMQRYCIECNKPCKDCN